MISRGSMSDGYFYWMCNIVCGNTVIDGPRAYNKLLQYLYDRDFVFINPMDENRAIAGVDLRYRYNKEAAQELKGKPCSILEMMVALALQCEESIMMSPDYDDRTSQWFWEMIQSLGLDEMNDGSFNIRSVNHIVDVFLERRYRPNGKGGLFTIRNCDYDLRDIDIWYQMNWYLETIL